jgi:hypothetical protein
LEAGLRHRGLLDEDRAVVAAAGVNDEGRALVLIEVPLPAVEGGGSARRGVAAEALLRARRGVGRVGEVEQLFLVGARGVGVEVRLEVARGAVEHDLAAQIALVLLKLLLIGRAHVDDLRGDGACGRGRPGFRVGEERDGLRLDDLRREALQSPAATERPPRFEVRVLEAPLRKLVARPLVCALHVGRACKTRADDVRQIVQSLHQLRAVHPLVADALDWVVGVGRGLSLRARLSRGGPRRSDLLPGRGRKVCEEQRAEQCRRDTASRHVGGLLK